MMNMSAPFEDHNKKKKKNGSLRFGNTVQNILHHYETASICAVAYAYMYYMAIYLFTSLLFYLSISSAFSS